MVKRCICLFFVINSLALFCMEQRPKLFPEKLYSDATEIPLTVINQKKLTMAPVLLEANQGDWQKLNAIANMTYTQEQSLVTNTLNLVPIYRTNSIIQTKKVIESEEKKLLLHKTIPDPMLIEKLYNDAYAVTQKYSLDMLIKFITDMNNARNNNIDEDIVGKYAHKKWKSRTDDRKVILFFGYLKKYNLTVNSTKECSPSLHDIMKKVLIQNTNNQLAQILGLSSSVNINTHKLVYDDRLICLEYPAFYTLNDCMSKINMRDYWKVYSFIYYIYLNQKIVKNKYAQMSYADLKDNFYETVDSLIRNRQKSEQYCTDYLYCVIKIVEAGKALTPCKQESDFGCDIIKAGETTICNQAFALLGMNLQPIDYTTKKIYLLCHLIKKYNDQRATKITPTNEQHENYFNRLSDFALPNSFDSSLFDNKIYAFDEFEALRRNVTTLVWSTDQNVQECFDQLYPQRK